MHYLVCDDDDDDKNTSGAWEKPVYQMCTILSNADDEAYGDDNEEEVCDDDGDDNDKCKDDNDKYHHPHYRWYEDLVGDFATCNNQKCPFTPIPWTQKSKSPFQFGLE